MWFALNSVVLVTNERSTSDYIVTKMSGYSYSLNDLTGVKKVGHNFWLNKNAKLVQRAQNFSFVKLNLDYSLDLFLQGYVYISKSCL